MFRQQNCISPRRPPMKRNPHGILRHRSRHRCVVRSMSTIQKNHILRHRKIPFRRMATQIYRLNSRIRLRLATTQTSTPVMLHQKSYRVHKTRLSNRVAPSYSAVSFAILTMPMFCGEKLNRIRRC